MYEDQELMSALAAVHIVKITRPDMQGLLENLYIIRIHLCPASRGRPAGLL